MTISGRSDDTANASSASAGESALAGRHLRGRSVVGRYVLKRVLGRGGQATVYEALDTLLFRRVALKVDESDEPEEASRFLSGARIASQLRHPNIMVVFDLFRLNEQWILVQELLEGENLRQRKVADLRAALRILSAIAAAMEYANSLGVLHRDLKPENVFCGVDGSIKVLDFGLARDRGLDPGKTWSLTEGPVGTPQYIAPERWGDADGGAAGDVWSFGVLAYELLVEEVPFEARTLPQLIAAVTGGPARSIQPRLNERYAGLEAQEQLELLGRLIDLCLDRAPAVRPAFAAIRSTLSANAG